MSRDESGQAGVETIPLGILVFVAMTLLVVNVWSVVDARMTVDSAARTTTCRAYTGATTPAVARSRGEAAASGAIEARHRSGDALVVEAPGEVFGPCRAATVTVTLEVPAIRLPFLGSLGTTHVSTTQRELVEPYGSAVGPDLRGTVCDG